MEINIDCEYDELISIGNLKPHPKNRNTHPESQLKQFEKILKYQGIRHPIIVSRQSGYIVAGHGRLEVFKRLGMEQVPVDYQDFTDGDQEYAFIQSDNGISQQSELDLSGINSDLGDLGPDFDLDYLGIANFELEPAEKYAEKDADETPEPPVEPTSKIGDLYKLGNHRLLCGDATNIEDFQRLFGEKKAELCFTSPPYADQREYEGGKELSTEHLATFLRTAFRSVNYFAVNLGYARKNGEVFDYWNDYISEAKNCGLKFLSWNIWDREYPASIGQQTAMFPIEHEWIFIFGVDGKELNQTVENKNAGVIYKKSTNRQNDGKLKNTRTRKTKSHRALGTIYQCDINRGKSDHPAAFPVSFPEEYILAMTDPGGTVYEAFGGSGSTLIACEKTDRTCYMMELEPRYVDVIVKRWENYTGQQAEIETL